MTFLSVTPDALFHEAPAAARPYAPALRPPRAAHLAATLIVAAALFVPGAVVQAKWSRLGVVFSIVHQRCMASLAV